MKQVFGEFSLQTLFSAETKIMGTMAKFSKHESLSAVKKDK